MMDTTEDGDEEGTGGGSGGWQRATPSAWQDAYPSDEAEQSDIQIGTRDYGDDDQGLPEYDTTNMAARQQEFARLVGLIQQDPDAFMEGVGDGSIPINVQLTDDQVDMLTRYVGVERAAQLRGVLNQMF